MSKQQLKEAEWARLREQLVPVAHSALRSRRGHVNFDPESVVQEAIVRLMTQDWIVKARDKGYLEAYAIAALRSVVIDRAKAGGPEDRKNTPRHLGDQDAVAATPVARSSSPSDGRWFLEVMDEFAGSLKLVDRQLLALLLVRDDLTTEQAVTSIRSDPRDAVCAKLTIEAARQRKKRLRHRLAGLLLKRLEHSSIPREDLQLLAWVLDARARSPSLAIEREGMSHATLRSRLERIIDDVGALAGIEGLHLMVQTWFPRERT